MMDKLTDLLWRVSKDSECQLAGQKAMNEFRETYNSSDSSGFTAVDDWVKNFIKSYYNDMYGREIDID